MIRKAKPEDAKAIADIYNYYISNSICTFQEEEIDEKYIESLIESLKETYPWLVFEEDGIVRGYAYARSWKGRSAYRHTVESSVYVDINSQRRMIGEKLLAGLLEKLRKINVHCVLGGIALPNEASIALHEKLGFYKSGQLNEVGLKFGKWIDVGYWQKILQ